MDMSIRNYPHFKAIITAFALKPLKYIGNPYNRLKIA